MQITDSFTQVMNISYGYVSHSFNQFIKVENGHIIAADHGDAHPRSIALIKYTTDVSDGSFVPDYGEGCISKNILSFPGGIGNNSTGASLGGFELSGASYLIAGNSVIQDENNLSRTARNVFVASADKDTLETEIHWLTSYKDGDGTVSTPQLVKIDQNRFIILWSKDDNVYYAEVDKSGKTTGDTYSLEGHLSDCVPIIFNNKLIWYTWNQEKMTFYEINLNNYAETSEKEIITGHQFQFSKISDGTVHLVCSVCGEEKQQPATKNIIVWWQEGNMWTTRLPDSLTVGDKLNYLLSCYPDGSDDEIDILIGDTSIAEYIPGENNSGTLKMLKAGKTTITARSKWNPDVSIEYSINVKGRDGQVLYGDANSDGEVDSKDAVLVKKYLAGYSGLNIDREAADVNGDGEVDSKDAVRLLRHLAGYNVELGE